MTKKKQNNYFTDLHEQAIINYAKSTDNKERTLLYISYIEPAFNEMVDKIVFTYKFTTLPNIDDLRAECKIWLTTILDKFDPASGSKAFSYFSVITKNWFIHKVKKTAEQTKREVGIEDLTKTHIHDSLEYKIWKNSLNNYVNTYPSMFSSDGTSKEIWSKKHFMKIVEPGRLSKKVILEQSL